MNIPRLKQFIEAILLSEPSAIKEFDLIQRLQSPPYEFFTKDVLRDQLKLFQTHFLVFHCLYLLRDEWRASALFDLQIDALAIQIQPYDAGVAAVSQVDKLRSYYLDLEQWFTTTRADVDELIDSFWLGVAGLQKHSEADVAYALKQLSLEHEPASLAALKTHYRKLVHTVHPDKGGDTELMQEVQRAYRVLSEHLENTAS